MTANSLAKKTIRHLRLAARAHGLTPLETPPYLTLYVTSACELSCEHCTEHAQLNQPDDLRTSEIVKLSEELGRLESLHITGGEPLLREDLAAICTQFIRHNALQRLSISTSGHHVARTTRAVERVLAQSELAQCVVELSIDGMADFHNRLRGDARSFDNAIQSYYGLAAIARRDPRLRLRVVSTATRDNLEDIERLSHYLYERCPQLERHGVNLLQGERRRGSLRAPDHARFSALCERIAALWADRARSSQQRMTEPLLSWAKARGVRTREQAVPCKAGVLSAVVYANGDVAVCETDSAHPHLGNLRDSSFRELWSSPRAQQARTMIRTKQCACVNERCLVPSLLYQPTEIARAMLKDRLGDQPHALPAELESPLAYSSQRPPAAASTAPVTLPRARRVTAGL